MAFRKIPFMSSDPVKELMELLDGSGIEPDEGFPRVVSRLRDGLDDADETVRASLFGAAKAHALRGGSQLWQILTEWFDSWLRTVFTGGVVGAVFGFLYQWIYLPS